MQIRKSESLERSHVADPGTNSRPTHERLIKALRSILRLLKEKTMFTYLDESLRAELGNILSTNNLIEGGTNAGLREVLHNHRGAHC